MVYLDGYGNEIGNGKRMPLQHSDAGEDKGSELILCATLWAETCTVERCSALAAGVGLLQRMSALRTELGIVGAERAAVGTFHLLFGYKHGAAADAALVLAVVVGATFWTGPVFVSTVGAEPDIGCVFLAAVGAVDIVCFGLVLFLARSSLRSVGIRLAWLDSSWVGGSWCRIIHHAHGQHGAQQSAVAV